MMDENQNLQMKGGSIEQETTRRAFGWWATIPQIGIPTAQLEQPGTHHFLYLTGESCQMMISVLFVSPQGCVQISVWSSALRKPEHYSGVLVPVTQLHYGVGLFRSVGKQVLICCITSHLQRAGANKQWQLLYRKQDDRIIHGQQNLIQCTERHDRARLQCPHCLFAHSVP